MVPRVRAALTALAVFVLPAILDPTVLLSWLILAKQTLCNAMAEVIAFVRHQHHTFYVLVSTVIMGRLVQ